MMNQHPAKDAVAEVWKHHDSEDDWSLRTYCRGLAVGCKELGLATYLI